MPKRVPPLTQLQIKNAKPREKPYKLADGGGLYLEVTPSGGKHWRMKYRQPNGKENKLHFGAFPAVSLLTHASGATVPASSWPRMPQTPSSKWRANGIRRCLRSGPRPRAISSIVSNRGLRQFSTVEVRKQ